MKNILTLSIFTISTFLIYCLIDKKAYEDGFNDGVYTCMEDLLENHNKIEKSVHEYED